MSGSDGFRRALVGSLACLLLTSCGLIYSYPSSEPESDKARCSDGKDNDNDGKIDCDDAADCAGFCPEDGSRADAAQRCTDGVDNDGDGFIDGADPLCWSFAAPQAQRCGVLGGTLDATFDVADPSALASLPFTTIPAQGALTLARPPGRLSRADTALALSPCVTKSTPSGLPIPCAAGMTGGRLASEISGRWADFELEFSVSVAGDGQAQVALAASDAAADDALPKDGAALLKASVVAAPPLLEGEKPMREARLSWGAQQVKVSVPDPELCGLTYCEGGLQRFSIKFKAGNLESSFAGKALPPLQTTARDEDVAPRSRLFVMAQGEVNAVAYVDDVHARFRYSLPCGFFAPQMPRGAPELCAAPLGSELSGATVSAASAPAPNAGYCALVSSSNADGTGAQVRAWRSSDGTQWRRGADKGSPLAALTAGNDVPFGSDSLVGQAVAWDAKSQTWLAVVSSRKSDAQTCQAQLFESSNCIDWQARGEPSPLPSDAEPPSLVVDERGLTQLYFTRPPIDNVGRTLWHSSAGSDGSLDQPSPIAEFGRDLHLDAPVALQPVGRELVLTYRLDPTAGESGLGVAVADASLKTFRKVGSVPLLTPNPLPGFDDLELSSGTVLWGADGGQLLYGARGAQDSGVAIISGVGTARLRSADAKPPAPGPSPPDPSPSDTEGSPIALDDPAAWQYSSQTKSAGNPALLPSRTLYVDPADARLHLQLDPPTPAGLVIAATSLSRALPAGAAAADFELRFELRVVTAPGRALSSCSALIGVEQGALAQAANGAGPPGAQAPSAEGVFAKLVINDSCFSLTPGLSAATLHSQLSPPASDCSGVALTDSGDWQQVSLRRENGRISVQVLRDTPCGPLQSTVTSSYQGAIDGLDTLLVAMDPDARGGCDQLQADLRNLTIRPLRDVATCGLATSDTKCEAPSGEVCVDLQASSEHCGDCRATCPTTGHCQHGKCECPYAPGDCGQCGLDLCHDGSCVFGACSSDVGESCASPSIIPPEGGTATFRLSDRKPAPDQAFCADLLQRGAAFWGPGVTLTHVAAFAWTPSVSGHATISTSAGAALDPNMPPMLGSFGYAPLALAYTDDPACATGLTCADLAQAPLPVYQPLELEAKAGTTYFILVGTGNPTISSPMGMPATDLTRLVQLSVTQVTP